MRTDMGMLMVLEARGSVAAEEVREDAMGGTGIVRAVSSLDDVFR